VQITARYSHSSPKTNPNPYTGPQFTYPPVCKFAGPHFTHARNTRLHAALFHRWIPWLWKCIAWRHALLV